ncbi:MAG TPA: helix-turn-helix domain-containing protein [Bacillales bacterium]
MKDIYYVEDLNQLKVLSDPFRVKILWELNESSKTGKMLADQLELPPSKMRYHLKELEKVGLIVIERTEEKNGILQKFYSPIAKVISLEKIIPVINGNSSKATDVLIESALMSLEKSKSLLRKTETNNVTPHNLIQGYDTLALTPEEFTEFKEKLNKLKASFHKKNSNNGAELYHINVTAFPIKDSLKA